MSDAIQVRGLSKRYRLGTIGRQTLNEELLYWWLRLRGRDPRQRLGRVDKAGHRIEQALQFRSQNRLESGEFWALRDVSFNLPAGQVLGIIGRNGAGKSTLLKILSRITEPTAGEADIEGRVGSLLEVGTGFHPDLTGRENVYMNGTILGMRKSEIDRKFDEIVSFAEVESFIDTPVKRYSSGMMVRLAFAVAAHLEPEILIVDEVLAVGDASFQRKCLGKMSEVASHARTVLFVSHNMQAVESLCDRVIWLDEGAVRLDGETETVVAEYLKTAARDLVDRQWPDPATAPGNEKVRLMGARISREDGQPSPFSVRTPLRMEFDLVNGQDGACLSLLVAVRNEQGVHVFSTRSTQAPDWGTAPYPKGRFRFTCRIPGDLLNNGVHIVQLHVMQNQTAAVYRADDLLSFEVKDSAEARADWHGRWGGAVRPALDWQVTPVSPDVAPRRTESPA